MKGVRSLRRRFGSAEFAGAVSKRPVEAGGAYEPSQSALNGSLKAQVPPLRIALYSPGTVGLGHIRRNLLIARTLVGSFPGAVVLIVAGSHEATAFGLFSGLDYLALPALRKGEEGNYRSRCLGLGTDDLVALRSNTIRALLAAFEPHVFIVDYMPRGVLRELDPTLEDLRTRGKTRCILGLRDVLGHPDTIRNEWNRLQNEVAIRDYYDAVWVYGDSAVYDLAKQYQLSSEVTAKVHFTGYLDQRARLQFAPARSVAGFEELGLTEPFVLCEVGGGQDGARLAEAFTLATLPPSTSGVIVTGPLMPPQSQQRVREVAAGKAPRLRVLEFVSEPASLVERATRVIGMGGYNTVCEVLSFEKPALIVPHEKPSMEQMIRAERLRDLGLLDVIHPNEISPEALSQWMADDRKPPERVHERYNFKGLLALSKFLRQLLAGSSEQASIPLSNGG